MAFLEVYAIGGLVILGLLATLWVASLLLRNSSIAVGDLQMARFRANPANKGQVMDRGVWRYTRHPNYFGDATQWWSFYFLAAIAGGWWTILSPILMTGLLLRVSGVALLERTLKETKPGYKEYVERTSAFIPWFPRRPRTS